MSSLPLSLDLDPDDSYESQDTFPDLPRSPLPRVGRLTEESRSRLSFLLVARMPVSDLVARYISREEGEGNIQQRSERLGGLLGNRTSKQRLQELNIIKEASVAGKLVAMTEQLERERNKVVLDRLIAKRPKMGDLVERGIVKEVEQSEKEMREKENAKMVLGSFFGNRPSASELTEKKILQKNLFVTNKVPRESQDVPTLISVLKEMNVFAVHCECAWGHTAILSNKGELYTCGNGENGRLALQSNVIYFFCFCMIAARRYPSTAFGSIFSRYWTCTAVFLGR